MPRITNRGSYIPRAVSQPAQAEEKDDGGGGLLGLGFGPNIGIGGVTALKELGEGVSMLANQGLSMLTPAKDGMGAAEFGSLFGKGIASSVAGTVDTFSPLTYIGKAAGFDAPGFGDLTEAAWGKEYEGQDFFQKVGDRGIIPALIEDVGNVALAGAAITAPVKGAALASRMAGATNKASKLEAIHRGLINKPMIRAAQHPYRVSAESIRKKMISAKTARDAELGLLSAGPAAGLTQRFSQQFGEELGLEPYRHVDPNVQADPKAGKAMAAAYDELPDFDNSPETQASFQAYAEDIERQFDWAQENAGVRFEFVDEDPYGSHAELMEDVQKNGRMKVFKTQEGDHPYLTPEQNDKFRAVHDLIGHLELGNDFSRHGEEAAWALHAQMFRPEARRAMTVETRGQNSALNFSDASEARRAEGLEPEFAAQKVALLPEEFSARDDAYLKPTTAVDRVLAKGGDWAQGVETRRYARDQMRVAETARRIASRSKAMRLSTTIARDHILAKAKLSGQRIDRKTASLMVGEAIENRITGVQALIDEALEEGKSMSTLREAGVVHNPIPTELHTPELEQALTEAVDAWILENEKVKATLLESRRGDEGLSSPLAQPDATTPEMTAGQKARMSRARRALERVDKLNEQVLRQREIAGREILDRKDRIGRLARELGDLDNRLASTIEAFDHSRSYVPKAWRSPYGLQATVEAIHKATLEGGGASFDPHAGRFLELGKDDGFMVAVLPKTILEVPVDQFTPADVHRVIDAYQDLFQSQDVMVGTWIDEGMVHVDLSERIDNIDDALIKGGARQQLAITDMARGTFPSVPLRARPDIAAAFLERNTGLKRVSRQIRDALTENGKDIEDAYAMQDLLMRQAVRARDLGQVAHPDDFFRQFDVQAAKRPSKSTDALRQIVKRWDPTDPKQQDLLWEATQKVVKDLDKALLWYNRSHEGIERLLRDKADITLLDGVTKINPADLTYQLLAVTSFNESPRGNLLITMRGLANMLGSEADVARSKVQGAVAKVAGGKMTLDELLEAVTEGAAKKGTEKETSPRLRLADATNEGDPLSGANVPLARSAAYTLLSGKTLDQWSPQFMMDEFKDAWGIARPPFDPDKAYAWIEKAHPEMIDRATQLVGEQGPDAVRNQAVREFYGSKLYTKVLSFWDNLAHPETSQAVTLDMWMARLFGKSGFETQKGWADVAEGVRQMADKAGVKPHQIQAALWVYINKEVAIQRSGHFLARAEEARELVRNGEVIGDVDDPILTWAGEAAAPYQPDAPGGFQDAELPVMRDGAVSTETVSTRKTTPKKERGKVEKQAEKWLKVKEQINQRILEEDFDGAEVLLDKHIAKTQKALAGTMGGDANAMDFADLLDPDNMTPTSLQAFEDLVLRLEEGGQTFFQAFEDDILGEFVPGLTPETRSAIRLFKDGNLATLVHENGHMLRRMLPKAEMDVVERTYGVKAGKWTVDAEERFANDFLKYTARMEAPAGLEGTFARVRTALKDIFDMVMRTFHRGKVDPEVADIFDRWLNPDEKAVPTDPPHGTIGLDLPTPETGTRPQIGARPPKYPEVATKPDFYQSGRRGARALAEAERVTKKRVQLEQTKARLEKDIVELEELLESGMTKAEIEQRKLRGAAARMRDKVDQQLGRPSMEKTPTRWQPLYQAWRDLAAHASETDPIVAGILSDAKDVLPQIQLLAMERGFNPAHVSQFSPTQVRRLVFENMQLGLGKAMTEDKAGARNKRTGALQRLGVQERSLEALLSASIDATVEARTNGVIDYVEKGVARRLPKGAPVPKGWVPWSPSRTFLLTGQEVSEATGKLVETTPTDTMVVPEVVAKMLRAEVADHTHWSYTSIGKITSPWRAFILTMNPGWYVRNFAGNVAMAMADGVSVADWKKAWASYRSTDEMGAFADVPFVQGDTLANEAGSLAQDSTVPGLKGRAGLAEAMDEGGRIRGATGYAMGRLQRVNAVVDEFARAAVYHKGRRLNMTKEAAWKHASEALVDYQNLSPFERKAVRSVVPFYSWQKGILKVTANQALDHPARAAIMQQLGMIQAEYVADLFGVEDSDDVPDYYRHIILRDRNIRAWNPFADTSEILTPEGIASSMNPFMEIAVRKGLGAPEFFPESYRLGKFGTVEADVDVPAELGDMAASTPVGRILSGDGGRVAQMGLQAQDTDRLKERILASRDRLQGG